MIARAGTLAVWHGWTAFAGLQAPYSLPRRDIERELLPMAEALGPIVTAATRIDFGSPATFIRDNIPRVFGAAAPEGDTTTLPGR